MGPTVGRAVVQASHQSGSWQLRANAKVKVNVPGAQCSGEWREQPIFPGPLPRDQQVAPSNCSGGLDCEKGWPGQRGPAFLKWTQGAQLLVQGLGLGPCAQGHILPWVGGLRSKELRAGWQVSLMQSNVCVGRGAGAYSLPQGGSGAQSEQNELRGWREGKQAPAAVARAPALISASISAGEVPVSLSHRLGLHGTEPCEWRGRGDVRGQPFPDISPLVAQGPPRQPASEVSASCPHLVN
jgi:hypothetical protein